MTHLLDTSAYFQAQRNLQAAQTVDRLTQAGSLAVSSIVMLEILYSARNRADWAAVRDALDGLDRFDLTEPYDAVQTQAQLADRGLHRTSIVDVMVATTAAEHGLTVLHYDRDFERLSEVTGADQEWVVPAGKGHRR
jgi:predicted nucleic acid-binding protein